MAATEFLYSMAPYRVISILDYVPFRRVGTRVNRILAKWVKEGCSCSVRWVFLLTLNEGSSMNLGYGCWEWLWCGCVSGWDV